MLCGCTQLASWASCVVAPHTCAERGLAFANFSDNMPCQPNFHTVRFARTAGPVAGVQGRELPAGVFHASLSLSSTRALGAPRAFCRSPGRRDDRYNVLCKCPATQAAHATLAYLCPLRCAMLGSMQHQDMTGVACCMLACPSFQLTCYARSHMLRSSAGGSAQEQPLVADACMRTVHTIYQRSAALSLLTTQPAKSCFRPMDMRPISWVKCVRHEPRHAGGPDGQHVGSVTVNTPPRPRRGSRRQSETRLSFTPGHGGRQCGLWREAGADLRSAVPARRRSCIALVPVAMRPRAAEASPAGCGATSFSPVRVDVRMYIRLGGCECLHRAASNVRYCTDLALRYYVVAVKVKSEFEPRCMDGTFCHSAGRASSCKDVYI
jgi:hypothetical protein